MLPISREPVKAAIRRSFSARAVAPGRTAGYLWPPTARSTAGEDFSLAGSIRKRAPLGFLVLALRCQNSLPSAGCLAALALCARLAASALFRRSGRYGHRNQAQAPEHVGSNQQGRGRGCASGIGCLRQHHCRLSSDVNWFRLGAFFLLARPTLTLLTGDFVPGFQDCPERAGP
jgi:hypothetical protein